MVSVLTSIFYLGTSTGSVFTGKIADKKGRRICIICNLYIFLKFKINIKIQKLKGVQ